MSKYRLINTDFWDDDYIENLNQCEAFTYIYLFSGPQCRISGIYEFSIPLASIRIKTSQDEIKKNLKKFEADGKIVYKKPYIYIKNFIKNQKLSGDGIKGAIKELHVTPDKIYQILNINKNDILTESNNSFKNNSKFLPEVDHRYTNLDPNLQSNHPFLVKFNLTIILKYCNFNIKIL